ncbi:MAG: YdcF family protein [Phyllobacterium sp.]
MPMDSAKHDGHANARTRAGNWLMALRRRFVRPLILFMIVLIAAFLGGFVVFADQVTTMQKPASVPEADGIIVLTGGYSRIETALDLLKNKRGQRLLISGVHPSTKRNEIQRVTHGEAALFECCIDIGRAARDTIGNASETASWITEHGYRSVIVVTNNYHIPRSMIELSRTIDGVTLIPYPVVNTDLRKDNWITRSEVVRVLLTEYVKYLATIARSYVPDSFITAPAAVFRSLVDEN